MTKLVWRRRWWVLVVTVAVFLSVVAVAWAAGEEDEVAGPSTTALSFDDCLTPGFGPALGGPAGLSDEDIDERLKAMKERGKRWLERQGALMDKLREQMSEADKALYDQLVAAAKEQREAVREARQKVAETLEQLRDLRHKYLEQHLEDLEAALKAAG